MRLSTPAQSFFCIIGRKSASPRRFIKMPHTVYTTSRFACSSSTISSSSTAYKGSRWKARTRARVCVLFAHVHVYACGKVACVHTCSYLLLFPPSSLPQTILFWVQAAHLCCQREAAGSPLIAKNSQTHAPPPQPGPCSGSASTAQVSGQSPADAQAQRSPPPGHKNSSC